MSAPQSLGNPVSSIQRAAVIQSTLRSHLNYATVASVLGKTEAIKAKSGTEPRSVWKFRHFWPIMKLYAGFQEGD